MIELAITYVINLLLVHGFIRNLVLNYGFSVIPGNINLGILSSAELSLLRMWLCKLLSLTPQFQTAHGYQMVYLAPRSLR